MKSISTAALLAILAGCTAQNPGETAIAREDGTVVVNFNRSAGVETGDEHLEFGSIESICLTPDGNIALLDRAWSEVRIFSPEGEYLRTIGGQGSGPGELNMTVYMGISNNGNLYVSQRSGCNEFDYASGEWVTAEQFNGPPPISITGSQDSTFVAIRMEMIDTEAGMGIDVSVSRFTDPYTADVRYTGTVFDLNPADMSNFFQKGWYGYCFDVDRQGNVFISQSSQEEYLVTGYTSDGEPFMSIEKTFNPVMKTEAEILEEKRFFEARFQSLGMGSMAYTPLEHWNSISGVGVDDTGRIWVRRGEEEIPTYDVYDSQGEELFTAVMESPDGMGRYWQFRIEAGTILAWPEDPESGWQKFYFTPLPSGMLL